MNKSRYRYVLNRYKKYLKLGAFADEVGITRSNLSYFLKGPEYDMLISESKLQLLIDKINDIIYIMGILFTNIFNYQYIF